MVGCELTPKNQTTLNVRLKDCHAIIVTETWLKEDH